jgi:hypothetical protein
MNKPKIDKGKADQLGAPSEAQEGNDKDDELQDTIESLDVNGRLYCASI